MRGKVTDTYVMNGIWHYCSQSNTHSYIKCTQWISVRKSVFFSNSSSVGRNIDEKYLSKATERCRTHELYRKWWRRWWCLWCEKWYCFYTHVDCSLLMDINYIFTCILVSCNMLGKWLWTVTNTLMNWNVVVPLRMPTI